jgi:hypothetical protein
METTNNNFAALAAINVNDKTEKKNGLTYLSWAWAVDQLMRRDPSASWVFGEPVRWNETVMVSCTVTAFGKAMTAHLPVMDHRNKAIPNPDAFQANVAMQRCLVKAIALHGLGLYIYAGEDLPEGEPEPKISEETLVKLNELGATKEIAERINLALAKKGRSSLGDLTETKGRSSSLGSTDNPPHK